MYKKLNIWIQNTKNEMGCLPENFFVPKLLKKANSDSVVWAFLIVEGNPVTFSC